MDPFQIHVWILGACSKYETTEAVVEVIRPLKASQPRIVTRPQRPAHRY